MLKKYKKLFPKEKFWKKWENLEVIEKCKINYALKCKIPKRSCTFSIQVNYSKGTRYISTNDLTHKQLNRKSIGIGVV